MALIPSLVMCGLCCKRRPSIVRCPFLRNFNTCLWPCLCPMSKSRVLGRAFLFKKENETYKIVVYG